MGQALLRCVLGVIAGVCAMFVVIMAIEFVGNQVYPPPAGIDPRNPADVAAMLTAAPMGALVSIAIAWVAGAFAGGAVAAWISRIWPKSAAIVVALVVVAGVVSMIAMIPNPQWLAIVGLVFPVPAALAGAWLARPRHAMPSL